MIYIQSKTPAFTVTHKKIAKLWFYYYKANLKQTKHTHPNVETVLKYSSCTQLSLLIVG